MLGCALCAQSDLTDLKSEYRYHIKAKKGEIIIDGKVDDEAWQDVEVGTDFWQKVPFYEEGADPLTEVKLCFDKDFLYVSAKCFQTEDVIIQSLKRDEYWDSDGIAIILDPLDSRTNAVLFGTSAVGVQWDAVRTETSDITSDWSNKWYVETEITPEYWSAEFAIPFRILRYNQNLTEWGLNFVRNISYCNEYHNWTAVPEGFWPPNPAFSGALVWESPPEAKQGNFNIIPYVVSGLTTEDGNDYKANFNAGADAKIALSSSLNLDLTLNPDFSQVEVDELLTNLTRFNIALPEKRNFFLENADMFADFGSPFYRPFFSRRIGLDEDFLPVPILYGARLTGNVRKDVRIGLMNVQSLASESSLAQNQSAVSARKQFGRSFIQAMMVNRQSFEDSEFSKTDYGRNLSLEAVYSSTDGQLSFWGAGHRSFKHDIEDKQMIYNTGLNWQNQTWQFFTDNTIFQENYYADLGFLVRVENYDADRDTVIRVGYNNSFAQIDYRFRPKTGIVQMHNVGLENFLVFNPNWTFNEQYNRLRYFINFKNKSEIRSRLDYNKFNLLFPFSFTDATPLPAKQYETLSLNLEYQSDIRKPVSYNLSLLSGGFYNGRLDKVEFSTNFRYKYWANLSVGYQWNFLQFPDPYGQARISALISRLEVGFNRNLLWTTLFQFADQSGNLGINSRIQWRFSPMSDIFLVYIDNYLSEENNLGAAPLTLQNRALLLKANYWY